MSGGLTAATARSHQLDAVANALATCPGDSPYMLALLLAGDGRSSMLSAGACAAVLWQLGAAIGGAASDGDDAAAAALQVASTALLSPALSSHSSEEVLVSQLGVLSASFSLLAQEVATQTSATAAGMAVDEALLSGSDSEEEEAALRQPHERSEAGELAAGLWRQADAICGLLQGAHQAQQDCLVESLQAAVLDRLEPLQSEAADAAVATAAVDAAGRLAAAAQLAATALAPAPVLQQQLLRGLLLPPAAGQTYGLAHAALLCSLGQALGFGLLLGCLEQRRAAQLAVDALAALEEAQGWLAEPMAEPLLRHVAGDPLLLSAALEAALEAAEGKDEMAIDATIAIGALLEAATEGGEGECEGPPVCAAVAAAFFGRRVVEAALQQEAPRPERLHLLLVLLKTCAPAFRRSMPLLHASGLPRLAAWLCEQSAAVEPVALASSGPQQQQQQMDVALADGEGPSTSQPSQEQEQQQHSSGEGTDDETLPLLLLRAAVACFPAVTTAEQVMAAGGGGDFGRGDAVWYLLPDGNWAEAAVVAVDRTVQPPSYGIQLVSSASGGSDSGAYRETEGHRLKARRPDAPPPLPAPAARARAPEPESEEHERGMLRALLLHQARGLRGAALAREEPSHAARAGVAALAHAAATYCGRDLGQQAWAAAVELSGMALAQAAAQLSAAVRQVVAALCTGAMAVGGAALGSPPLALHFWRQLQQKGVLARSVKVRDWQKELLCAA